MTATIEVLQPGMLTTVQDAGRPGLGRYGVSPSGAMDPLALCVANVLVGNPPTAAALEVTGPGASLLFLTDTAFALAGARLGAHLDDTPVASLRAHQVRRGQTLRFRAREEGARLVLAVSGGLDVPAVFGSAATDLAARLGGIEGRPLARGDRLASLPVRALPPAMPPEISNAIASAYHDPGVLSFIPEDDSGIPGPAHARFTTTVYRLSDRSNRTGYRFIGEPLPITPQSERLSEPTAPGAIQLPPDGLPILLMADRNTTGGYPRLGHLTTADRPKAAQLWPGDPVRFVPVTRAEALRALRARTSVLARLGGARCGGSRPSALSP